MGSTTSSCRGKSTTRQQSTVGLLTSTNQSLAAKVSNQHTSRRNQQHLKSSTSECLSLVDERSSQPRVRIYKEYVPKKKRSSSARRPESSGGGGGGGCGSSRNNTNIVSSSSHDSLESLFLRTRNFLITEQQHLVGDNRSNFAIVKHQQNNQQNKKRVSKSQSLYYFKKQPTGSITNSASLVLADKSCQVNLR